MLLMENLGLPFGIVITALCVAIVIHALMLAGRLVRAVEKIAAKDNK